MFRAPMAFDAGIRISVHPRSRATSTIVVPASAVARDASPTAAAASMLLPTTGRSPARPSDGCPVAPIASSAASPAAAKWGAAASGSPVTIDSIATASSDRALVSPRTRFLLAQMPSRTSRIAKVARPAHTARATRLRRVRGRHRPDGAGCEAIVAEPYRRPRVDTISPGRQACRPCRTPFRAG